ncbi:hypothetical protein C8Q76DRAFT_258099 [Earliella scabrosa]|nr:hypothetical protein C8Q76DRAFT_258099 [Earliella scabrosa]
MSTRFPPPVFPGHHCDDETSDLIGSLVRIPSRACDVVWEVLFARHYRQAVVDLVFPVEIWRAIFDELDSQDKSSVVIAALIYPALRLEAEAVLYHTLTTPRAAPTERLIRTLSSCPRRARTVRRLVVSIKKEKDYTWWDKLPRLLRLLPELEEIEYSEDGHLVPDSELVFTERLVLPQLKRMHDVTLTLHKANPGVRTFLRNHPALEELWGLEACLICHARGEALRDDPIDLPHLRKLRCDEIIWDFFTPRSLNNLTHLALVSISPRQAESVVHDVVNLLGPQLVSLYLERLMDDASNTAFPYDASYHWERCGRLEYLHMADGPDFLLFPREHFHYDDVAFASFPPRLRTLVWTIGCFDIGCSASLWAIKQNRVMQNVLREAGKMSPELDTIVMGWGDALDRWHPLRLYKCTRRTRGEWTVRYVPHRIAYTTWVRCARSGVIPTSL